MTTKKAIRKGINEAKTKKTKIHEYLSGGDELYALAIRSVRRAGAFATALAYMSFLMAMAMAWSSLLLNSYSGIILAVVLLAIGIYQLILGDRLRKLLGVPKTIKRYLIIVILFSVTPALASTIVAGALWLPGFIPAIAAVFSINALYRLSDYRDWYTQFKYPIQKTKRRIVTSVPKEEAVASAGSNSDDDEYYDGL